MTATPAPAGRYADTVYDRNSPAAQSAGYAYVERPGYNSNEERLVSEALASQLALDPDTIRAIRPVTARTPLFPPRYGYDDTEIGIADVITVDRRYPDSSTQFSGTSGGYAGSNSPSLGWW